MRLLAALLLFAPRVAGQLTVSFESGLEIPAGSPAFRVEQVLSEAPWTGDYFRLDLSSNEIHPIMITPDGRRLTPETAEGSGFRWDSIPLTPKLGSRDGGRELQIFLREKGKSGRYIFEFDTRTARAPLRALIHFEAARKKSSQEFEELPGFRKMGPVSDPLHAVAELTLTLPQPETLALFDVVSTDPKAILTFTLPNGEVLNSTGKLPNGVEWKRFENLDIEKSDALLAAGVVLQLDGTHHVISLLEAPAGHYVIRAQGSQIPSGILSAAFLPFGSAVDAPYAKAAALPNQFRFLQIDGLPAVGQRGETIPFRVSLGGAPVVGSVSFQVQLEYNLPAGKSPSGVMLYADPVVRSIPVRLTRGPDGVYSGRIPGQEAGFFRLGVTASCTSADGRRFSVDGVSTPFAVEVPRPPVARLLSLRDTPVSKPGTRLLSGLKLTAELQVAVDGEYSMHMELGVPGSYEFIPVETQSRLTAGRRDLSVTIPAEMMRDRLKDGPWEIRNLHLTHLSSPTSVESIAIPPSPRITAVYRRSQWDRGEAFVEEQATAGGIYPAASGRARLVEVNWGVTTPGGNCEWSGVLSNYPLVRMGTRFSGIIPAGHTVLHFFFDASPVSRSPQQQWLFEPYLSCQEFRVSQDHGDLRIPLTLDPQGYEPQAHFTVLQNSIPSVPTHAEERFVEFDIDAATKVQVRVLAEIPGMQMKWTYDRGVGPNGGGVGGRLLIAPTVVPGRYLLPILVEMNPTERTETALVVDVAPPRQ